MPTTITYNIPNISCDHCVHAITTEISDLDGVVNVVANLENKQATITFGPPASDSSIKDLLAEINYPVAA